MIAEDGIVSSAANRGGDEWTSCRLCHQHTSAVPLPPLLERKRGKEKRSNTVDLTTTRKSQPNGERWKFEKSVSAHASQQSFTDASNQLSVLMMYPSGGIFTPPPDDLAHKIEIQANGSYADALADAKAISEIDEKAATLGYGPQDRTGEVTAVDGGYLGRFPNHDIYSVPGGAAVEVHGDIRAKFNALGGAAGLLGIPMTDEQIAPDGVGRYNHFKKGGSIYWTPRTGPMSVRGTVRDHWASTGWERGPFGYPVQDQHRMVPITPTDPIVEWCRFENGVIAGDATGGKSAPPAQKPYAELGRIFGARLNEQFQASPKNVALRPGIDLIGVSNWQYGFWSSISRAVGFRVRGFHDNGLAPDTDFSINIWLRFELVWSPSFTEPTSKTLVAVLDFLRVIHDSGPPIVGGAVVSDVASAIAGTFFPSVWPDPTHPEVPKGAIFVAQFPTGADLSTGVIDILDVLISSAGDLHMLVNPLTPPKQPPGFVFDWGHERQRQVQDRIDSM